MNDARDFCEMTTGERCYHASCFVVDIRRMIAHRPPDFGYRIECFNQSEWLEVRALLSEEERAKCYGTWLFSVGEGNPVTPGPDGPNMG